ncbi:glycosyltransferase family 4 protein [[Clostridium] hylemonae]|uniref:Glycosyltransferase, group 1 family protein n=1 Tax=[Clostridium] hylemonae DSM 15053 TaxID=553973 RepID=C0C2E7_9FIRM|nr:glycosyltransferase family 4 protein [[Clostridium] hylemonae]EEG73571.1 glycosyltransferase, group 1 family protein [[Clostridium] hylemonae DSM 15053]QEK17173.1 Alpha-D-kanosaminyltransferase [[Clostridium] hylemonae DSM 15053]
MKKIAIVTMGVKLNNENGYTRFRFLAEFLAAQGYDVDLLTTSFQHWAKKQRNLESIEKDTYPFNLRFIPEPGYKKNIDVRRLWSHRIAAKNLKKMLVEYGDYDLIYCEIPPNDVALAAAKFAKDNNIPFVVDVNDLWPEAMHMVIDIPIISNILFYPLFRSAEKVYNLCSGVVGTSDEYTGRPFKRSNRDIPKATVYVGNELRQFDEGAAINMPHIEKSSDEFWVSYAGTIGTSYDIKTMIQAADVLKKRGYKDICFKILGGGPLKEELESYAKTLTGNVEFVGYAPYEKMAAYLKKSDILVNSFVKKAPQSIVTKIGDYLAAGKPMINTCSSIEFRNKVISDGFGINIEAEDMTILADAVLELYNDEEKRNQMGYRARAVAEEQFDRPCSYNKIVQLMEELLKKDSM